MKKFSSLLIASVIVILSGCYSGNSVSKPNPVSTFIPTNSPVASTLPVIKKDNDTKLKVDLTGKIADEILTKKKIRIKRSNVIKDKNGNEWLFYYKNDLKNWYLFTPKGLVGKLSYPTYHSNNLLTFHLLSETGFDSQKRFFIEGRLLFGELYGSPFNFSRKITFTYNEYKGFFEINKTKSTCDQSIFDFNLKRDFSYELELLRGFDKPRVKRFLSELRIPELNKSEKKEYSKMIIYELNKKERVVPQKVYVKDSTSNKEKTMIDLLGLSKFFVKSLKIKGSRLIADVDDKNLGLTFNGGSFGGGVYTEIFVHTLLSNFSVNEIQILVNGRKDSGGEHFNFDRVFKRDQNHDDYLCPNSPNL